MKRFAASLGAFVLVALTAAVAVPAMTALGHASYESSTPDDGENVQDPPTEISAFFSDEIRRQEGEYYLRVQNDAGEQVSEGDGTLDDDDRTNMVATFPDPLPAGRYSVHWKTLSDEDGDTAQGVFCFYVQTEPTQQQINECNAMGNQAIDATETAQAAQGDTPETTPATTPETTPAATSAQTAEPGGSPTPADGPDEEDDDDSNTGIIIGIIVTVIAVIAVGGGIAVYMRQRQ